MAKDDVAAVKDAIHKLQYYLLEGIQEEKQLTAAGFLMSRNDYQDVVTERTIAMMCGYPLCRKSLPSERPNKGRYRISLKEHKVYDLQETYLYCSTSCIVSSRAFAARLPDERCSVLNPAKLNEILRLFEGLRLDSEEDLGENGDLGLSKLNIQEITDLESGEVSFEDWISPSDAIEGYTPQKERTSRPQYPEGEKEGSSFKSKSTQLNEENRMSFNDMDFTSAVIITQDEYTISESPDPTKTHYSKKSEDRKGKLSLKDMKERTIKNTITSVGGSTRIMSQVPDKSNGEVANVEDLRISSLASGEDECMHAIEVDEGSYAGKALVSDAAMLKSSLKSSNSKKATHSVTWADEKPDINGSQNLCEYRESNDRERAASKTGTAPVEDYYSAHRLASAEACAEALSQAAEAVTSGQSDVYNAVSEAGLIVLPAPQEMNDDAPEENDDALESDRGFLKWPKKSCSPNFDLFDSEDSWYDNPPKGFSLTLSPFATMFMSLFAWVSSSSLAYIYGRDESSHEEYLCVNGREYPRKVVHKEGRSYEIRETFAGCLARALPGLITDLRLPTPVSVLEQGMARLLDTMSFIDPLPSFRMKQWEVIDFLFLDALSVCRIPALAPYMTGRRLLLPKVLEGAQVSAEEYETMKDLMIPLGRVPQFSSQSGG